MFHVRAHKNVSAPAGQVSGAPVADHGLEVTFSNVDDLISDVRESVVELVKGWKSKADVDAFYAQFGSCEGYAKATWWSGVARGVCQGYLIHAVTKFA